MLNQQKLDQIIHDAFRATVNAYADQCQEEFDTEQYRWPGSTARKSGEIAGTTRDITDEGELKESQQEPEFTSPDRAVIEWTANHAALVHEGDGADYLSRPWTRTALQHVDLKQVMVDELKKRL